MEQKYYAANSTPNKGKYIGDPKAIMNPHQDIRLPESPMYPSVVPKAIPPDVIESRMRIAAQDIAVASVVNPLSKVMVEDVLPPIYDDAGNCNKYSGIPRNIHLKFSYEDERWLQHVAKVMASQAIKKAIHRLRLEGTIVCPWKGNTRPTFET
uniref:Reverse transcriptase domain-containing protein n=1 Tax=Mesocestoides corti TaxID=53468 RepID=A0A5K3ENV6_MESCO